MFKNIIHVAVPLVDIKDEQTRQLLLSSCVINALEQAKNSGAKTIAIKTFTSEEYGFDV